MVVKICSQGQEKKGGQGETIYRLIIEILFPNTNLVLIIVERFFDGKNLIKFFTCDLNSVKT